MKVEEPRERTETACAAEGAGDALYIAYTQTGADGEASSQMPAGLVHNREVVPVLRLITLLFTCAALLAAEDWTECRSGPFTVLSSRGGDDCREALNELEQLRYVTGVLLGKQEVKPLWPVQLLLLKPGKDAVPRPELKLARDRYVASLAAVTPELRGQLVGILLEANAGRLPGNLERGLGAVLSSLKIEGTRVSAGAPPPVKDRDWSRMHMLIVDPDYGGKVRVLLGNLEKGIEAEPAWRNAFSETPEDTERKLDRYIEAGRYAETLLSSRPINPRRDFLVREADAALVQTAQADLLLAHNDPGAGSAWEAIRKLRPSSPEADEALGLMAAAAGDQARARVHLSEAAKLQGRSPRAALELARLGNDPAGFRRAAELLPGWAEPYWLHAQIENDLARKIPLLKMAAERAQRRSDYWEALAAAQEQGRLFADAGRSWLAAERAAANPRERERIRQTRLAGEQRRREAEQLAREEELRRQRQELEDLKNRALADIRAAEARANAGQKPYDLSKLDWYREGGDRYPSVSGTLEGVECLGRQARLVVRTADRTVTKLLVRDPAKVVINGGGEKSLQCGRQRAGRPVKVDYMPRADAKLGTSGDVLVIDFRR